MSSPDPRAFHQLRHDVDDVYELLNKTNERLTSLTETVHSEFEAMGERVEAMGAQVGSVGERVGSIDNRVTTLSATQRRHGNRLEEIQQALDLQNGRLDRMEDSLRQILEVVRK